MAIPDIVIAGYLGNRASIRKKRLEMHIEQTKKLAIQFPKLVVRSYCSNYSIKERRKLASASVDLGCHMRKHEVHNMILDRLYQKKKPEAVLFLDNDVILWDKKDTGISDDPANEIMRYLKYPDEMPASCLYFSCAQLRFDAFYRNRKSVVKAPMQVVGWAMMVRNDLGVLYPEDTYYQLDDFCFRSACYEAGKEVLKMNQIFFSSLQRANDNISTAVKSHEERIANRDKFFKRLLKEKPHLYQQNAAGRLRFVKRPDNVVPGFFKE